MTDKEGKVALPVSKPVVSQPTPAPRPKMTPLPKRRSTPAPAKSSAPISITQKVTASWVSKGKTYYRYSTTVTNKSTKTLTNLQFSISKLYGPLWGLVKISGSYGLPAWVNSLPAGMSIEFVCIHSASPADVSVSAYRLA